MQPEIDLEMRLQREKHLEETTKMALANDEARITANAAHPGRPQLAQGDEDRDGHLPEGQL